MSKLQFRARALDASKPMLIYMAEELPDLTDYSAINRAVPQMPSGMEKEEECEHHLQRAICTGLIIPTPEVSDIADVEAYDKMYPATYKQPRQLIHMQPFTMEQDIPDYDMDSEDERWVEAQAQRLALTPFKFETMMDRLEKSSGQTVIQLQEAKLLLKENDDLTIAVYDYWLNKRLKIQQPLILNVKTEHRGGSGSASSPYLAFRRRTEKMQTRKNRKNDEVSYEKMLKLRRDLTRAISILDLIKRREKSKRDLLHLQIEIIDKRYKAQDYNGSLISEVSAMKASRPAFAPLFSNQFVNQNWANSKAVVKPDDLLVPRKEKRQYKKRKHKSISSHTNKTALAASGLEQLSSDEDELPAPANIFVTAEEADQTDAEESPFAFRRNVNCSYHMPVANGYGNWPWCSREDNGLADHKYRFTLASVSYPKRRCIGFARRRLGRGGRVILDRVSTPMDDFWRDLDFTIIDTHSENERMKPESVESNSRTADVGSSSVSELKNVHSEHNYNISSTAVRTSSYNRSSSLVSYSSNSSAVSSGCSLSQQNRLKAETDFDNIVAKTLGTVNRTSSTSSTKDLITNKRLSVDDVNKYVVDNIKTEPLEWTSLSTANATVQVKREPSDMSIEPSVNERLSGETSEIKTSSAMNSIHGSDRSETAKNLEMLEFLQEIRKDWLHFRPKTPPPDYEPPCHLLPVDDTPFNPSDGTPIKVEIETLTLGAPSMLVDSSTFTSEITLSDLYTDFSLDQLQFDTGTTTTYDYLGSSLNDTRQPDENTSANNNKQNSSFNDSDHIDRQQFGSSSVKWIDDLNSGSTLIADRTLNNNAVCDLGSRSVNSASVLIQTRKQNINVTNDSTQQQSILSSTLTSPKLNSVNNRYGEKKVSARIFCSDDEVVVLPSHIGSQYRLGLVNHVLESGKDATPSSSTAAATQTSHHRPMSAVTQALLSNGPVYHSDSLSPNRRVVKQQQTQQTSTAYSTGATVIGGQVITGLATARMANQRLFATASPVKRSPSTTHTLNSNSANLLELPQLDSIDNGKVKVTAQLNSGGTGSDSSATSAAANAKQTQQSTNNKQQIVRKTNNTLAMEVT